MFNLFSFLGIISLFLSIMVAGFFSTSDPLVAPFLGASCVSFLIALLLKGKP